MIVRFRATLINTEKINGRRIAQFAFLDKKSKKYVIDLIKRCRAGDEKFTHPLINTIKADGTIDDINAIKVKIDSQSTIFANRKPANLEDLLFRDTKVVARCVIWGDNQGLIAHLISIK